MPRNEKRNRRSTVKAILVAVGLLLVVGLVAYAFLPEPEPVEMGEVDRGLVTVAVEGDGRTRVIERFLVFSPATGTLSRISAVPGDESKKGHVVTTVSAMPPTLTNARDRAHQSAQAAAARAALKSAQARAALAETTLNHDRDELARARTLRDQGALANTAVESAELAYRAAVAGLESAQSGVDVARFELASVLSLLADDVDARAKVPSVDILAPIDGVVLRVHRRDAGPIAAGEPLVEFGDPAHLEVVIDLLTADAMRVRPGAHVTLTQWGGGAPLTATVSRVEPSGFTTVSALGVEEQRVNVLASLPERQADDPPLGDAFRVHASIEVERHDDALRVPMSALVRREGGWAVFRVEEATAHLTPVELGAQNDEHAEVKSGLSLGDRVVMYPSDRILDGAAVRPR